MSKPLRLSPSLLLICRRLHLREATGILASLAGVLAMIFLDEKPAPYHAAGIGLIFSGIWLNTRHRT